MSSELSPFSKAVGEALGDRYEILSLLGEGTFGKLYKARDVILNRTVAVKSIRMDTSADPEQLEELKQRFLREAQVVAQLRHPNIVTIHDIKSTPQMSLLIMEFVEGISLKSTLTSKKRLGLVETIDILSRVAKALDYAHRRKVIHRDVKPANIMITSSNDVRVTDFGIAKIESSHDLTLSGTILGTPDYMSPEQASGEKVDGRSDLFSLGCILYECLAGEKPFRSKSLTGVLLHIVSNKPPPKVDCQALGLPESVESVVGRALAKDPDKRFPTAESLIQALRASAMERPERPPTVGEGAAVEPVPSSGKPAEKTGEGAAATVKAQETDKSQQDGDAFLKTLEAEERRLSLSPTISDDLQNFSLTPAEGFILSRIDGRSRPRDILALSPLSDTGTARTLLGLLEAGLVRFEED